MEEKDVQENARSQRVELPALSETRRREIKQAIKDAETKVGELTKREKTEIQVRKFKSVRQTYERAIEESKSSFIEHYLDRRYENIFIISSLSDLRSSPIARINLFKLRKALREGL